MEQVLAVSFEGRDMLAVVRVPNDEAAWAPQRPRCRARNFGWGQCWQRAADHLEPAQDQRAVSRRGVCVKLDGRERSWLRASSGRRLGFRLCAGGCRRTRPGGFERDNHRAFGRNGHHAGTAPKLTHDEHGTYAKPGGSCTHVPRSCPTGVAIWQGHRDQAGDTSD